MKGLCCSSRFTKGSFTSLHVPSLCFEKQTEFSYEFFLRSFKVLIAVNVLEVIVLNMMSPFDVSAFEHSIAIWVTICAICTVIALAGVCKMLSQWQIFVRKVLQMMVQVSTKKGATQNIHYVKKRLPTHPVTNGIFLSLKKPINGCGQHGCGQHVSITTKGF